MVVGQAGVGKGTLYKVLQEVIARMAEDEPDGKYHKVQSKTINPKSVTMG